MTLAIIGAGLGRTGTSSLRLALNQLGHPCYHMFDLAFGANRASDVAFWNGVQSCPRDTPAPDWEAAFSGYRAVLDYPACFFWRELMLAYPDARVVLTRHPRGSEAWYDSTLNTIYARPETEGASQFGQDFNRMMDDRVWNGFFEGRFEDRDFAIARYEAHNRAVFDGVPADRLLLYTVTDGWGPICAALDTDIPDRPFPKSNDRAEMARRVERLAKIKALRPQQPTAPRDGTFG